VQLNMCPLVVPLVLAPDLLLRSKGMIWGRFRWSGLGMILTGLMTSVTQG
jgi:hypothetical protein